MSFAIDTLALNAKGGTEIMKNHLEAACPPELFEKFQIYVSRVEEPLDPDRVRLLWLQDTAGDPGHDKALSNGGWRNFHKLIFSSHWQMRGYLERYNIPWSRCLVIRNGIEPIENDLEVKNASRKEKIKLIYTPTPHRGLNILYVVFDRLSKEFDDIELDVYSSFALYGWNERDKPFQDMFEALKAHPKINYHGTVSNEDLRQALTESHIFAYPSTWAETSCLCLMEAMSAGNICVHSNFGALYETAGNWTNMYQYHEDINQHAHVFYEVLKGAINEVRTSSDDDYLRTINTIKASTNVFFNIHALMNQWKNLLEALKDSPTAIEAKSEGMFEYRS